MSRVLYEKPELPVYLMAGLIVGMTIWALVTDNLREY